MILARSVLFFFSLTLVTLGFGLALALFGWFLPSARKEDLSNRWSAIILRLLKAICGLDYRVTGVENLPQQASIIMAKHQSTWETIALRHIVGGLQSWVLKRELMWVPVFGWALATMSPIAIDRKAGRRAVKQVIAQGIEYLRLGHHVIIFPEGTRTSPGEKRRYGVGGALLAEHSGISVIPIAHNAGVFWQRRSLRKLPGIIDVVVGPPIPVAGRRAQEIIAETYLVFELWFTIAGIYLLLTLSLSMAARVMEKRIAMAA